MTRMTFRDRTTGAQYDEDFEQALLDGLNGIEDALEAVSIVLESINRAIREFPVPGL